MVQLNSAIATKLDGLAGGVLSGHYIFDKESSDSYLKKRFEKPAFPYHNVSYEFTEDKEMLEQYFAIRNSAYQEVHGHKASFEINQDEFDNNSHTLVVKSGGVCVGGARTIISSPDERNLIPIESDGVDLNYHFPRLNLKNISYAEPSRFAMLSEYRSLATTREIYAQFLRLYESKNVGVCFVRCPLINFRSYRMGLEPMGYTMVPRYDIDLDFCSPAGIKMVLIAIDMTADKRHHNKLLWESADEARVVKLQQTEDSSILA